jgi:hypothetical protein
MLRVRGELTGSSLYYARKTMRVPLTGRVHLCGEAEAKARERFLGVSRLSLRPDSPSAPW